MNIFTLRLARTLGGVASVTLPGTPIVDPGLPAGFAPFGIQAINGDIHVAHARQNPAFNQGVAELLGNSGNGEINAYDLATGFWAGTLRGVDHQPIRIDGLWGLQFGHGLSKQPTSTLFFAAGPDGETHGLCGRLDAVDAKNAAVVRATKSGTGLRRCDRLTAN